MKEKKVRAWNFYTELRKANKELDRIIEEEVLSKGVEIDINLMVLDLTNKFAVSEKAMRKRLVIQLESRAILQEGNKLRRKENGSKEGI